MNCDKQIMKIGKYKGKTYSEIMKIDINYCNFALSQISKSKDFNDFKIYVSNNLKELYDFKRIRDVQINCSELSKYLKYNDEFINLIKSQKITVHDINTEIKNVNVEPRIFGQFIDYLMRYRTHKLLNRNIFTDDRSEWVLSDTLCDTIHELYEEKYGDVDESLFVPSIINVEEQTIIANINIMINDNIIKNRDNYDLKNITNKYFKTYKVNIDTECEEILNKIKLYNKIKKSYDKVKNMEGSINDIFNVSLCHGISFGEHNDLFCVNNEFGCVVDIDSIDKYLKDKIRNENKVLCNPILGNSALKIQADADLIIGTELIDIKTSITNIGDNINDYIQLFVYICLYYKNEKKRCRRITIVNPLLQKEYTINLENWDGYDNILNIFESRITIENSDKPKKIYSNKHQILDNIPLKKPYKLDDIAIIKNGITNPDIKSDKSSTHNIPYYTQNDIKYCANASYNGKYILIVKTPQNQGKIYLVNGEFNANENIIMIKIDTKFESFNETIYDALKNKFDYVNLVKNNPVTIKKKDGGISTSKNIGLSHVKNFVVEL